MTSNGSAQFELLGGRVVVESSELLAHSRARAEDVVILSGTLLEGFGNLYSDLDLYVIGEELPTKGPNQPEFLVVREDGRVRRINETLVGAADLLLDVQFYTFRELDTLGRSLSALYEEARHSTRTFRRMLHHDDEDLIHKLLTGRLLQGDADRFRIRETFDPGVFCFLKYRNEVGGYQEFRDLVGSWSAGDLDTCLYNTRGYLISQVSGMMYLTGSTNPRAKWFLRKLGTLGAAYAPLREGVFAWLYSERRTAAQKCEAIDEACRLIDLTYAHGRELLGTNPRYFTPEQALAMIEREFGERPARDRDTMAEWQLRRRLFSSSETPLSTQVHQYSPQ